ncbi:bifunctional diguanylate cyclase/phosphodiesterase [Sphingomonas xinjiangensis]|uniref:bifunctional diguanylate cyclase/phosphodiesterase n=1 Tax=Sphingomonas xinjiangensis TaxID=643568 RepID=UPI001620C395|nr:EAL domain-containing protein [Sphingomonas xinjiangensis]
MILEMVAKGESLQRTAERLCCEVEERVPGVICSVLLVDESGTIHPLAAPSLPDDYSASLEGLITGPQAGSCGSAAYYGKPVTVTDIETDQRWASFKALAVPLGLAACWSSPIKDAAGRVIGTFAFYFREKRGPSRIERRIVDTCLHLCAIAIERHQRVLERERRAYFDDLTGLPNRAAFDAALTRLSCQESGSWALLVADLDNLKVVNDTFGHHAGDRLLQGVAERLSSLSTPDRAFRLGGDEFAILVQSPQALSGLEQVAGKILEALKAEVDVGGQLIAPRATIGGAKLTSGDQSSDIVRQNADFALYHAKETRRGSFVHYWKGLGTTMIRRLAAIREVDAALKDGRVEAHYQPIVNLASREIIGMEALCRLRTDDGVLTAGEFVDAFSDSRIAAEITARMLASVAKDVRQWLDRGIPFQHVGINVSSADFFGGKLADDIAAVFDEYRVPLKHVVLEVTESVYMGERDDGLATAIAKLRAKGLLLALDDFGTGFASLTHLLSVPVDILKIDKSFVAQLAPGEPSAAIVEGLLSISKKLGMRVVAEGVEHEEQVGQLLAFGCTIGQGFLFSEAVDFHAATDLLEQFAQRASSSRPPRGAQSRLLSVEAGDQRFRQTAKRSSKVGLTVSCPADDCALSSSSTRLFSAH